MREWAFVIADGTRAKYGITAVLGALDGLPDAAYPDVHWPRAAELPDLLARLAGDGVRPVVLWSGFSPEFGELTGRRRALPRADGPGAPVHVLGGAHASAEPEAALRAGFDLVAPGEGEHTIRALAAALAAGSPLTDVEGLARLDGDRFVRARGRPVDDLDEFGSFARRQRRIGPIEITRGCVYACRFCQTPYLFKARFRHRSVASVRDHVRFMASLGKKHVRFLTPTALSYGTDGGAPDLDAVERLLTGVRTELLPDGKVYFGTFPSEVRPEHGSREAFALIRRLADNDNVIIGGQSGSDALLAASHRGHDVASVAWAVDNALAAGLTPNVDFIFGMPGETDADVAATIARCRELAAAGARIHTHTFLPLPGTPWAAEPPGVVGPELRAELDALTTAGRAYGSWRRQQAVAAELAGQGTRHSRRRARPTPAPPAAPGPGSGATD